ncbi:MAG: hypothetical protein AAFQ63_06380 [Cyanobacteria bacterium J06621_11]
MNATAETPPTKILQIVPRVAPDMDGVGEYTLRLSKRLKANHNIESEFLVFRPSDRTPQILDGFPVHRLDDHATSHFLSKISPDISTVVLQYSNYPYLQGKLDAPMWLAPAMRALQHKGIATVVMFHELPTLKYGVIKLPNPIQGRLSRDLAKMADVVLTNNEAFQTVLSSWRSHPVYCMPNFATIGEPQTVLPLSERDRAIVVFGSTDRRRVYQSNLRILKEICDRLSITKLYDVGRELEWDTDSLGPSVETIHTGMLSDSNVSQLMSKAFAGIFDYHRFPKNLGKSTVYAAYCAHGLLPICNGRFLRPQDGTFANQHYVDTFTLHDKAQAAKTDDWLQTIASNAHALYLTRSLDRCAETYADLVQKASAMTTAS